MNPYKLSQVYKQLTSQNSILKKYLKLGTKDIKQPDLPAFVETKNAVNRFMRDNPRPDQLGRKDMAGGGMLVQPSADGSRPGYKEDNVGGKVAAKEVKDFKTNINNWTKNWIKENINNYNIRQSDKFINDLKKAWAKESKNKKYKVVGVDSAKSRVLTQNGFPAVSTNKAVNSFNIFGYEMPGGIKTENIGNAQRNLYSKIFFTNTLKNNPQLNKKLNFYFDYITADKRGTNASSLSKKVTNIMAKAGVTDPKELLDKDVMYLLSKDSGMGDKARYEFFVNNYGNKYINYRNKVDTMHGDYIKNVRILKDKFNINVKSQLNKENNALKKIFDVNDLPFELRYSGDHLFGVSQAAKSNNKKFAAQAVNNLVGMTREQNKILGLGEFERTRKNLISKINTAKVPDKKILLTELNDLMKDTYQDYFGKKQSYYSLDKGKVTISKDFVPLSQEQRFTNYFKQIDKTKEGKAAIKKQAGSLDNLLAKIGCPNKVFKASGGRVGYQDGTDICPTKGANLINSGMKNATPAQLKNFAAFANRARGLGRGLMKFGIIPEAMYVAADSAIRLTMGDKPIEALLRASEYLLPGDQTKIAEVMEATRLMNPETAAIIGRSLDYKNQLAKIQSLEDTRANLENLSGGGEFDYIGDLNNDVRNLNNQIKQATDALNTKFKMTDAELIYANRMQDEIDDIRKSRSLTTKLKSMFRDVDPDSDVETLAAPEKTQEQLNLKMADQLPRDLLLAKENELINYAKYQQSQGFDIPDDYYVQQQQAVKNMSLAELAAATSPEQIYGASGTMGEPLNKGVVEKPQNVISDMEREIIGQTNVANPFDIDLSMIGSGLRGFSAAGGGIAKEAGVDSGVPPESGPNPQGLSYLMKRGKNI